MIFRRCQKLCITLVELEKRTYLGRLYSLYISEIKEMKDLKGIIEESRKYGITERAIEGSLYSRISRKPQDLIDAEKIYKDTYRNNSESLLKLHNNKANSEIAGFNDKIKMAEEFVRFGKAEKALGMYKLAEKMCRDYQMLAILSESVKSNIGIPKGIDISEDYTADLSRNSRINPQNMDCTQYKKLLNGILNKAVYHGVSCSEYTRVAEIYCEIAEYKRSKDTFKKAIYVSKDYRELRDVFLAVGKSVPVQEIKCSVMRECMKHIKQNEAKYLQDNENRKELAEILEIYTGRNENTEQLLKDYITERKRLESEKEANKKSKGIKEDTIEENGTVVIDGEIRTHAEAEAMGLGDAVKYDHNISASEMGKAAMNREKQMSEMGTETVLVEGQVRTMNELEVMNAADKARYDKSISAAELSSVEQKKEDLLTQESTKQDKEQNLPPNVKVTPW